MARRRCGSKVAAALALACASAGAHETTSVEAKSAAPGAAVAPSAMGTSVPKSEDACPALENAACAEHLPLCVRNAVVRLRVTHADGSSELCTGTTLISSRGLAANFARPYVLTAADCVPDQAAADSVETHWFHESASCAGDEDTLLPVAVTTTAGAELLVRDEATGIALVELRDAAPPGGACMIGWHYTRAPSADGTAHAAVFQPGGSAPRRFAEGTVRGLVNLYSGDRATALGIAVMDWTRGRVAPEARGAPLLWRREAGQWGIIGVHLGTFGRRTCPSDSVFGRFDLFARNAAAGHLNPDIALGDDHGGDAEGATALPVGTSAEGAIDGDQDADVFSLEVEAPGRLIVNVAGSPDLIAHLTDARSNAIALDDDAGFGVSPRLSALLDPGTYHLRVAGFQPGATGAYTVHTLFTPAERIPSARLAFVPSADNALGHGFIRLTNTAGVAGTVEVFGIDDEGVRAGPVSVALQPLQSVQITSRELEKGNPDKGLTGTLGDGAGDWRLEFHSTLDIRAGAYLRNVHGFLASAHDEAHYSPNTGDHELALFNPGSNRNKLSLLRIVNTDPTREVTASIFAVDDAGRLTGRVYIRLAPGAARTLDATELEQGAEDLEGSLGDGSGKWRLRVDADGDVLVVGLLRSVLGYLTNLSTAGTPSQRAP